MKRLVSFAGAMPFFTVIFLNAFVDLGHKIVIQNTIFKLYEEQTQIILTAVLNSMILLPYILLFYPAGRASDIFNKAKVMRTTAWLAVILCCGICVSYYLGWFWAAFAFTFLLATQSAFYSPAKMGYIKEMFGKNRLGEANGVVSALVITSILAGTLAFSILFESMYSPELTDKNALLQHIAPIGWVLLLTATIELVMSYKLPNFPATATVPTSKPATKKNILADSLEPMARNKAIRLAAIGLATFWAIGQVMIAAFPAFLKTQTGIENTIALQAVIACSGIGIAWGSFIAGKASRNHIELGILPIAALGIAVGLSILPTLSNPYFSALAFLFIGTAGGMFIVPLNALIQFQAREGELGKTLAANNWIQNVAMFSFLVLTAAFAYLSLSSKSLLQLIAVIAVIGCGYTIYQLPQSFVRILLRLVIKGGYKVRVQGMKNIPAQGGVLLLGNHVSWIDWAIIQLAIPRPVRFVMIRSIYERWYLKWFFDLFGCIPIEQGPGAKKSLDIVAERLKQGEIVCLFPEGTLSRTGHMVEFRKGYEKLSGMMDENIPIIPFYLHGLWGSKWSRATAEFKSRSRSFGARDLIIALGKPLANNISSDRLKRKIFELSVDSWNEYCDELSPLSEQWVQSARRVGRSTLISDGMGTSLSGNAALVASSALSFALKKHLSGTNIGVALPASVGCAIGNMALLQQGKTLVNLNFTAGEAAFQSALEQANIEVVISSRRLEKKLHSRGINLAELCKDARLVFLEDIKPTITLTQKISALIYARLLPRVLATKILCKKVDAESTACILFSSGSEGKPKGVCLSHKNVSANIKQIMTVLDPQADDVILGNLPPFHAFGLTVTQMLPMLEGIPVVCHADPTDALGCAKLITRHQISILFGTSTFLRFYIKNRRVHPLMLSSLRLVVSGAEKLQSDVKQQFEDKFKRPIYEGYGTTETTPVVSVNLPDKIGVQDFKVQTGNKIQSVGMPLPGTSIRIVDPTHFTECDTGEQGMVLIGGVQVMQGYLNNPEKTDGVIKTIDGMRWYVTGDKGYIDDDGFLFIVDRYSRFAKIGGEMVGLSQVEVAIRTIVSDKNDEDIEVLVVAIESEKKGEQLVALSTVEIEPLIDAEALKNQGLSTLALPAKYKIVDEIPKLASGKVNFSEAKLIASS